MRKQILAVIVALALSAGLWAPARAAEQADAWAQLDGGAFWVDVQDRHSLERDLTASLLVWSAGPEEGLHTRDESPQPAVELTVTALPLGVSLTAGPDSGLVRGILVYSDPDGDGIFEQRLEKYTASTETAGARAEVVPLGQAGPLRDGAGVEYGGAFDWGYGSNFFQCKANRYGGFRTITTDYLTQLFGPNTLLECRDGAGGAPVYYLLTGEERPQGLAYDRLEDHGVYLAGGRAAVSRWAVEPVAEAYRAGLVDARVQEAHRYDFTQPITRGEFAAAAVSLYGALTGWKSVPCDPCPFADVEERDPLYSAIVTAYTLGIINGVSETAFAPGDPVTREQTAAMLARTYAALGKTIPPAGGASFADDALISPYARDAVDFLAQQGIIGGVGGNRFDPQGGATVEQTLKIMVEMFNAAQAE